MSRDLSDPLVSIAMPIYNGERYLKLALDSLIRQSYKNWELWLIDDGSTDRSLTIAQSFNDPRIRIVRDGNNEGLARRLNQAIDLARGEYLMRMDQDDVCHPQRIAVQVKFMLTQPSCDLSATRAITIDENNTIIGELPFVSTHQRLTQLPWRTFYMPHPTWMGKRSWFKQHYYAHAAPYCCEDQELLLRTYATSQFATVDHVSLAYRIRSTIDLRKLFRTRNALLNVQLNHFLRNGYIFSALAAIALYGLRVVQDVIRHSRHKSLHSRKHIHPEHEQAWQAILKNLENQP
ncbi:glycosyltransferase family 2 protein [Parvibium lacunae]|uniref:Glycosyltransferase n=1 Tax=Parvibium lacunae TaxID=1888893 RepID=A0A368L1T4_9BURK|nr:glycosyltransferase [Parvibium lacunae]RCS57401.1 glycosyltransferase [Parvibium lacunae]